VTTPRDIDTHDQTAKKREYRSQKAAIKIQSLFRAYRVRKEPNRGGALRRGVATSMDEFEYPAILEEAILECR